MHKSEIAKSDFPNSKISYTYKKHQSKRLTFTYLIDYIQNTQMIKKYKINRSLQSFIFTKLIADRDYRTVQWNSLHTD